MSYTKQQAIRLENEGRAVVDELQNLFLECVVQGRSITDPNVQDHMLHGAARRVCVLKRSVQNVFALFPPSATHPLDSDALSDVQINLHAFVINLYGLFDNWAWAFVLRHNLYGSIGSRLKVGLFNDATKQYLPLRIEDIDAPS